MRGWQLAVLCLTALAGIAVIAGGAYFLVSMAPTVASKDRTICLVNGVAHADVRVPAGWSWQPQFGDDSRGVLGSPDRVMVLELTLMPDTEPAEAIRAVTPAPSQSVSTESLPAGPESSVRLLHARVIDRDVLVGALTDGTDTLAFVSSPSPAYDAELAALLSTIEVFR